MRRGFTLMEILVSVMLISIVILGIAKIREQSIDLSRYVANRINGELSSSLFLTKKAMRFDGTGKDAYELLREFRIDKLKTREILRARKRRLEISDPLDLGEENPLPVKVYAFHLKEHYSSTYYRIFF